MNRIIWIVIDSVGVGALPDAKALHKKCRFSNRFFW